MVIKDISLEGCPIIGSGASGKIYRINDETIVKMYSDTVDIGEIELEHDRSRSAFVFGIPTAIPFNIVKSDGHYGLIYELLEADNLADYIIKNPELIEKGARMHAKLLRHNHSTCIDSGVFPDIKSELEKGYKIIKDLCSEAQYNKLIDLTGKIRNTGTYIHGDCHPKNIMVVQNELMLVDMGNSAIGHPIFDIAALTIILGCGKTLFEADVPISQVSEEKLKHAAGMPKEIRLHYLDLLLKYYFETDDEKEFSEYFRLVEAACVLFGIGNVRLAAVMPKEVGQDMIKNAKEIFLPRLDAAEEILLSSDWII